MKICKKISAFIALVALLLMMAPTSVLAQAEVPAASGEQPVMTVDIVIFAGQSNMSGAGGNAGLSPAVPNGQGYEFRPMADMTALHQVTEPFGVNCGGYICDGPNARHGTLVSSFICSYYAKCGVPVMAVSAAKGGSDSGYWASPEVKADLFARYIRTRDYCKSNHIAVRRAIAVWLQGESDGVQGVSAAKYQENVISAWQPLFAEGLEQVYVITPGHSRGNMLSYGNIAAIQTDLCNKSNLFTLASTQLGGLSDAYLTDDVHYNQQALNMVGAATGNVAAR